MCERGGEAASGRHTEWAWALKTFRTILADPPWNVGGDAQARSRPWCIKGGIRQRDSFFPYRVQSLEWVKALPVADLAEDESHLYLWVPAKLNREGKGVEVAEAWGFRVVSEIVWFKPVFGLGKFPRPQHEIILVCRRGRLPFQLNNVGSVQRWTQPRNGAGRVHSAKPEDCCDLIERASPGPYVELFARRMRLGWECWGDQVESTIEFGALTAD